MLHTEFFLPHPLVAYVSLQAGDLIISVMSPSEQINKWLKELINKPTICMNAVFPELNY